MASKACISSPGFPGILWYVPEIFSKQFWKLACRGLPTKNQPSRIASMNLVANFQPKDWAQHVGSSAASHARVNKCRLQKVGFHKGGSFRFKSTRTDGPTSKLRFAILPAVFAHVRPCRQPQKIVMHKGVPMHELVTSGQQLLISATGYIKESQRHGCTYRSCE